MVNKIICALKTKQLERDLLYRLLDGLKNRTKPAPLETKGCGTLESRTNPKAEPLAQPAV